MNKDSSDKYVCPYTREPLRLSVLEAMGEEVVTGTLSTRTGREYPIRNGIAHLISQDDEVFSDEERLENEYYERTAGEYDSIMDWMFASFGENEAATRQQMVELLDAKPGSRIVEIGSGTCRDSVHIAKQLAGTGEFFIQDLSPSMLAIGRARMQQSASHEGVVPEFFVGNAAHLPFPDRWFDSAFHFGGLNVFTDKTAAILEMARVVKPGGKVVFGDEGLAPWLRKKEYGKILMNSSQLYTHEAPIELLPESARNVDLRWIIGNAYYLITFTVGEGPPHLEMDLTIPGKKGGTHRSRWNAKVGPPSKQ